MANLPLVTAALVCERVLIDNEEVPTLIRVVDTFTVTPDPPILPGILPAGVVLVPQVHLTFFLNIKAGDQPGVHTVVVKVRSPSGKMGDVAEWDDVVLEEGHGVNLIVNFKLPANEWGLHTFEATWDGEPLAKSPFILVLGRAPSEGAEQS